MNAPRRLILLRHAKSSWKDDSLPDDQRPLARRGRRAVAQLAQHLHETDPGVDLVLCSPARRTRQTWDGVRTGLSGQPEVRYLPEVYEATAGELLQVLNDVDSRYRTVLLIGHNPGMADLLEALVGTGEEAALGRLREGFPTGAVATLSFDAGWADLHRHTARLDGFVRPRDLPRG